MDEESIMDLSIDSLKKAGAFTGAPVKKEIKWAVPLEIAGGAAGLLLWLSALFVA